jgi:putative oxygen-independent coproporphyrinogen III oxidase
MQHADLIPSRRAARSGSLPPLSLYVHFPWCVRKCPYCDFNSHKAGDEIPEMAYIDALIRDLDQSLPQAGEREIVSVFLGGGTPSLFSAAAVERLLNAVRGRLNLARQVEITLEANPGTAEAGRFAGYRRVGVNRLSLGVQSFADAGLAALGRIHDAAEACRALTLAGTAGFDNINIDIMYGLPGQEAAGAVQDLAAALVFSPAHLSWYQLTLEPNTLFYSHPPTLPDDDRVADMQERGEALLLAHGYRRYEVSAWALPGRETRHNLNYWEFGDYLGLGAGAHSKLTDPVTGRIMRYSKLSLPGRYLETAGSDAAVTGKRVLGDDDLVLEFMMNALRLARGFEAPLFETRTGLSLDGLGEKLGRAVQAGLLSTAGGRITPTPRGSRFLNDLLLCFE